MCAQSSFVTLSSYQRQRSCDGVNPTPRALFVLDKGQRDRLVLLEPQLAPLIRRYHTSDDVQRYSVLPSTRFLLCLPAGWTARMCATTATGNEAWQCIAERFPALSRHLALAVAERPFAQGHWWELSAETHLPPSQATMTWHPHRTHIHFASVSSGAVCATSWFQQVSPWLLGYLNSTPIQRWIQRTGTSRQSLPSTLIDEIPIAAAAIDHPQLDALAQESITLTNQRHQLVQSGLLTLVRNFAPLGATPNTALKGWYDLDFAGLRRALLRAFKNDIPERLQPEWAEWLTTQQQHYAVMTHHIHEHDSAINTLVADWLAPLKG